MKVLKTFHLICCFLLSCSFLQATQHSSMDEFHAQFERLLGDSNSSDYGTASFSGPSSSWYPITTLPYPDPVLLSQNRNGGLVQGNVDLADTGLTVNDTGNFSVTVSVTLFNPGPAPLLVPFYLAINDVYDVDSSIGQIAVLLPNISTTVFANGIIAISDTGSSLTIIATNGESSFPHEIEVAAWGMSLLASP